MNLILEMNISYQKWKINSIGWARLSYAFTLKKNIMDISIPFLAKAAINVEEVLEGIYLLPEQMLIWLRSLFGDDLDLE